MLQRTITMGMTCLDVFTFQILRAAVALNAELISLQLAVRSRAVCSRFCSDNQTVSRDHNLFAQYLLRNT
jgi:hypothetical protein